MRTDFRGRTPRSRSQSLLWRGTGSSNPPPSSSESSANPISWRHTTLPVSITNRTRAYSFSRRRCPANLSAPLCTSSAAPAYDEYAIIDMLGPAIEKTRSPFDVEPACRLES
jgi:hypothetical protein